MASLTFIDWFDEEWRNIDGFGGAYKVSNTGKVLSVSRLTRVGGKTGVVKTKDKLLSQKKDSKGYMRVYLNENGKTRFILVHRLVAKAFLPNPENKPQVNHIDGNKTNNAVSNLEWCTNGENQIHAYKLGLNKVTGRAGKKKIPVIMTDSNCVKHRYESINEASRKTGIPAQNIGKVILGKRKTAGGFVWEKGVI